MTKEAARFNERTNRTFEFLKAKTLNDKWKLLTPVQKNNVADLVKVLGWQTEIAIQQVYIFDDSVEKNVKIYGNIKARSEAKR